MILLEYFLKPTYAYVQHNFKIDILEIIHSQILKFNINLIQNDKYYQHEENNEFPTQRIIITESIKASLKLPSTWIGQYTSSKHAFQ